MNVDINVRGIYKKVYWAGLSFRTDKDMVVLLGAQVGKFHFGKTCP